MLSYKSFLTFILLIASNLVFGQRNKDKMFSSISGASCFRRLNATHQTGCTSSFQGSIGVLHLVTSEEDIDFLVTNPPAPPYAPIFLPHLFTRANIMRIKNEGSQYITGIILINNRTSLSNFSHESTCPNQYGGLPSKEVCNDPKTSWNPFGTGLLQEDLPFPIFYISNSDEILKIVDCFKKFNDHDYSNQNTRSLCSIQMRSFMAAAVSSEVCMRRSVIANNLNELKFCDPLQGKNVYATLFPRQIVSSNEKINQTEKFILVTTRMDTTSFFDGVGSGALGSLVPYATLISLSHVLANVLPKKKIDNELNVLFVLFNGEAYDYIGSQRFVYDIKYGKFPSKSTYTEPINIEDIELLIDLGNLDNINKLKIYHAKNFSLAAQFMSILDKYTKKYNIPISLTNVLTDDLPPTSAQSFLRYNITFPAVILNSDPENKFYHSIYDDEENIDFVYKNTSADFTKLENILNSQTTYSSDSIQMKIRNISSTLAFTIYELITNSVYNNDQGASLVLIDEFLHCYLESAQCPLFKASAHSDISGFSATPPQRYISVHSSYTHESTLWAYRILGFLVSQSNNISKDNCTQLPLSWFFGYTGTGECHFTTQNFSQAYSPAFFVEGYDWKSGEFSTWTESTWSEISARIFLKPSRAHEVLTLAIGFIVMIISFVLVYLINSKSDVLFGNTASTIARISEPTHC